MCPCGTGKQKSECCQAYIDGTAIAPTAETLMRSRYTAYVSANVDYLLKSHHKSTRPTKERKEILKWTKSVQWMSLSVINTSMGKADQKEGTVEFRAVYSENSQLQSIHEKSLFRKEKGMWYYVSGVHF